MSVTRLPTRSISGSVLPAVSRWVVDPAARCLPVLRGEISRFARRAGLAPAEVDDAVLIAAGFPRTAALLRDLGHDVLTADMSEYQKMDGGLSCLSVRW